jgi:hypothetical protein
VPERYREAHIADRSAYLADPNKRPMGAPGLTLRGRRKGGSDFPAEISLSPRATSHGVLVTAIVRDISQSMQETEDEQVRHRLNEYADLLRNAFTHGYSGTRGDRPTDTSR